MQAYGGAQHNQADGDDPYIKGPRYLHDNSAMGGSKDMTLMSLKGLNLTANNLTKKTNKGGRVSTRGTNDDGEDDFDLEQIA